MEQDHYAVLGIARAADQATIRSAYRALMRRYHPDADSSDEAAEQARAINLAYATLGDPGRRAAYDGPGSKTALSFDPADARKPSKGWGARIGAAAAIVVAVLAAGMVTYATLPQSQTTNGLAASIPHGDSRPRAVATPSARKPLAQPKPAATESVEPLTTDQHRVLIEPEAAPSKPDRLRPAKVTETEGVQTVSKPAQSAAADEKCPGLARTTDRLICADQNLVSLDRQLTLLYRQSWSAADQRKRAALVGTRQIFNDRRDECETSTCLTSAYVVRLREISDIMAGRPAR